VILDSLTISAAEFESGTGWQIKPEGACKGDVCIPLPALTDGVVDVRAVAEAMQMPIAEETSAGKWALGPESIGGRALTTAKAPEMELPDVDGKPFKLSSLIGKKVLVYAWAPY
jgi:hypothetical protein